MKEYTIAERFTDNLLDTKKICGTCGNKECPWVGEDLWVKWPDTSDKRYIHYEDCSNNNRKDWRPKDE